MGWGSDQSGGLHDAFEAWLIGLGQLCQRQAQGLLAVSHAGNRPFHGDGVGFDKQCLVQGQQLHLNFHGTLHVASNSRHAQFMHQARCHVGSHAHVAMATAQHQRNGGRVITRVNGETFGSFPDQPLGALYISSRFLDADNARHLGQSQHRAKGSGWPSARSPGSVS